MTRLLSIAVMKRGACGLTLIGLMAACDATGADQFTDWSSDSASLSLNGRSATVRFLASGGCYGSYGTIDQFVGAASFSSAGTFTQLTGAYPGSVSYPAVFAGTLTGSHLTLTVTISATQQTLGPYDLTGGVTKNWSACLYP